MLNLIFLGIQLLLVSGYVILPYEFGDEYTKYRLCDSADENLINTTIDVMTNFNMRGFTTAVLTSDYDLDVIPICNIDMPIDRYGFATFTNKIDYLERSISISNLILDIPTTLWNVLFHELLHTVGLGHSKEPGLMNYTVTLDRQYRVIPDAEKLYPSLDDLEALEFLYPSDENQNNNVERNHKKIFKKLRQICIELNR